MAQPTSRIEERESRFVQQVNRTDPWRVVNEYLVDSSGANNMNVDGTGGSPKVFFYSPPANYDLIVNRLVLFINTSSAMGVDEFGNLTALTQGVEIKSGGVLLSKWQDNIDIYTELFDIDTLANVSNATPDTTMHGEWQFARDANGQGIDLHFGENFEVIINDDLSTITTMRIRIKGLLVAAELIP